MAGDSSKVKIGAAWVSYKGTDLGYTQGGITLSIENLQKEIFIDELGPLPQAIFSLGKRVTAMVPLAESDYVKISSLLNSSSYKIEHSFGTELFATAGDLVFTSKEDSSTIMTIHNCLVTGQVSTKVNYNQERIWGVTFVGYGTSTTLIDFAS